MLFIDAVIQRWQHLIIQKCVPNSFLSVQYSANKDQAFRSVTCEVQMNYCCYCFNLYLMGGSSMPANIMYSKAVLLSFNFVYVNMCVNFKTPK